MQDLFQVLKNKSSALNEADLGWVIPSLLDHYLPKIKSLTYETYLDDSDLSIRAFTKLAEEQISSAVGTFFFSSCLWKKNRDLDSYIRTCLNNLSSRIIFESVGEKLYKTPICPLCRLSLHQEDGKWRCKNCSRCADRARGLVEKYLYQSFALHSLKGYRCPECYNFLPASIKGNFGIVCPYTDCGFMGEVKSLYPIPHPLRLQNFAVSLTEGEFVKNISHELIATQGSEGFLEINDYHYKYKLIRKIIDEQIEVLSFTCQECSIVKKLLMYRAFCNIMERYPEQMVRWLTEGILPDFPIHSTIFQDFIGLMENYLPFSYHRGNKEIDITSILDKELSVFLGISEFDATVNKKGVIENLTKENYIGSKKYINYGPCFIGKLVELRDLYGNDLLPDVIEYTFTEILTRLEPGTKIKAIHYRIASHWETGALTTLRQIRKNIISKIKVKLKDEL